MLDFCRQLHHSEYLYMEDPNFQCPMAELEKHLIEQGSKFPVPQDDFNYTVQLFKIKTNNDGF